MKHTLLDLTQIILSSLDGDEINSISDTVESNQVATIIKTVYFDLVSRANFSRHKDIVSLTSSGDSTKPVLMSFDEEQLDQIDWIKYDVSDEDDTQTNFTVLKYMPLDQFLRYTENFDVDQDNVDTMELAVGSNTYLISYFNDRAPSYYTTTNDLKVLFDAYDADVDSTLQSSKTQCYGRKALTFEMDDDFIPDLDDSEFPLLINEAKSLAWAEMKQTQHPKAEQAARRNWTSLKANKNNVYGQDPFDLLPNYGRK